MKLPQATQSFVGQRKRYGDFFREWDVLSDGSIEEVTEWCFDNLYKRRVPHSADWHHAIRYGNEKHGDAGYYFGGYYDIIEIDGGYKFIICEPYAD